MFGNGWNSNCNSTITKVVKSVLVLIVNGNNNYEFNTSYILKVANGKRYEYKEQKDGSIISPAGRFDSLQKLRKGNYAWSAKMEPRKTLIGRTTDTMD